MADKKKVEAEPEDTRSDEQKRDDANEAARQAAKAAAEAKRTGAAPIE